MPRVRNFSAIAKRAFKKICDCNLTHCYMCQPIIGKAKKDAA